VYIDALIWEIKKKNVSRCFYEHGVE